MSSKTTIEKESLFEVYELKKANHENILLKSFQFPGIEQSDEFKKSRLFRYLCGILVTDKDGLLAKTIVVECKYLSLSFLGDHQQYYSQCLRDYPKICRRVHFFNKQYSKSSFTECLKSGDIGTLELQNHYLGHVVIRPISSGFIGASLLAHYSERDIRKKRFYTGKLDYKVNLFGHLLRIDTMPFFEQDQIISNCSSAALWFSFHKTHDLFDSKVPNPSEITLSAGMNSYNSESTFPTFGLEYQQVNNAIRANDLSPSFTANNSYLQNSEWLRAFIYSYSRMGVPVLMAIEFEKGEGHMVTVNGYRFGKRRKQRISNQVKQGRLSLDTELKQLMNSLRLRSYGIVKFYAHDDQVGPYSKLELLEENQRKKRITEDRSGRKFHIKKQFRTGWWASAKSRTFLEAHATAVIVPLKKEIRLPFQAVLAETALLNKTMTYYLKKSVGFDFHWEIYLQKKGKYKRELLQLYNESECDSECAELLYRDIPELVWVVRCYTEMQGVEIKMFDILYDAADVTITNNAVYTNFFYQDFKNLLREADMLSNDDSKISFEMLSDFPA